jgi:hypothetical protein
VVRIQPRLACTCKLFFMRFRCFRPEDIRFILDVCGMVGHRQRIGTDPKLADETCR